MKAQVEIVGLQKINDDLEAEIHMHAKTIEQLKAMLNAKEHEFQDAQAQLVSIREELNGALVILQAPMRMNSQEDAKQMIKVGMHAIKRLELVKNQFEDWKLRYSKVVPTLELVDKLKLERRLQEMKKRVDKKDEEIQALEESVEGAHTL